MGLQRVKQQDQRLQGFGPDPLHICENCSLGVLVELLTVGVSLTLLCALCTQIFLLGYLIQPHSEGLFLVLLYLVVLV